MSLEIVTLAQAKAHLRIADDLQDYDIELKLQQAAAIILRHMKLITVPAEWLTGSPATTIDAPPNVQAATLLVLSELFENREASVANVLSNAVKDLIPRTPTVA